MKVTRIVACLLAVALMAVVASDTFAQGRGGQGGRGGPGGGFGGRGGPGGGGGGDMTMMLLRMEPVQTELQISPDQEEAIGKLAERARPQRPDANFREMSDEERREFFEKMQAQQREQAAKIKEQLEEVLLPEQMERLDQIALQLRGVRALSDEDVAGKLKITADQKKKLGEVQEELSGKMREQMRELFTGGGGDRDSLRDAMEKARKEMEDGILGVLTSEQRKDFDEMKGEKFEMPQGFGFGGFGGRGGGTGGGRGGFGGGRGGTDGGGGRGGRGGTDGGGGRGGRGGGRPQRPPTEE